MSIQKKVNIKRAVQQAMDNLALEDNKMIPVMQVWASEAESRIGSFTQYKRKIQVLDVANCRAHLCCEAVAVLAVLEGDHGCECGDTFQKTYKFAKSRLLDVSNFAFQVAADPQNPTLAESEQTPLEYLSAQTIYSNGIQWRIHDNALVFTGDVPDMVTVEMLVRETDESGWILINENHVYAIASFIEWMYMKRARHKIGGQRYTINEIRDQFMEWSRMAAHAHAQDGEPNSQTIAQIAALVNDPYTGFNSATWIYADSYYGPRSRF